MSLHSAMGIGVFVVVFTASGYGLLFAIRGRSSFREAVSDIGLAYLVGTAGLGSILTLAVIAGVPFGLGTIVGFATVMLLAGVVAGRRKQHAETRRANQSWPLYLLSALFIVLVVLLLEAMFRAARLQGLYGWDAGSFWVPKAMSLFESSRLDEAAFTTLAGPSYPPLVPVLQAAAFEFIGRVDVVALHTLYFTFVAGFVGAGVRLLRPVASGAIAWGCILLVLGAHRVVADALTPQGDMLLDLYVGLAVAAVAASLSLRRFDLVALAVVFLVGAVLTKREGLLLVACVAAAAAIAVLPRWRVSLRLVAALAVAPLVATIPWRLWYSSRSVPGQGPESGVLDLIDSLDRAWPSFELVVITVLDPQLWSLVLVVMACAAVAALLVGERTLPVFALAFAALAVLGFTWVMWSFPSLPLTKTGALNPIPRLAGGLVLPAALLAAPLMQQALDGIGLRLPRAPSARLRALTTAAAVYAVLAYPLGVLAFSGLPRFPGPDDCAAAASGEPFVLVYDRTSSLRKAWGIADELRAKGFVGAEVVGDGCGRWEIINPDVETLEQAAGHTEDARRAGYEVRLESR